MYYNEYVQDSNWSCDALQCIMCMYRALVVVYWNVHMYNAYSWSCPVLQYIYEQGYRWSPVVKGVPRNMTFGK